MGFLGSGKAKGEQVVAVVGEEDEEAAMPMCPRKWFWLRSGEGGTCLGEKDVLARASLTDSIGWWWVGRLCSGHTARHTLVTAAALCLLGCRIGDYLALSRSPSIIFRQLQDFRAST